MNYPAASSGPKVAKNLDRGRRKRREIKPVETVLKALFQSFLFFMFNVITRSVKQVDNAISN
jgi:hypothetical protein